MGGDESKVSANDMNRGLLAMVVYVEFGPNPKSICMDASVAVCCGLSSRRFSTDGSNDVNVPQSNARGSGFGVSDSNDNVGAESRGA
jgi:hypothetical protein